jgi:hypothetical protein
MTKKISGTKRKEINNMRAADAVAGRTEGILFGRVVKLLGNGQVHVTIHGERVGPKTLLVRLPRLLSKRGSTPLCSTSIVSIFVGKDFHPDVELKPGEEIVTDYMFDITSILEEKAAQRLVKEGVIPEWMVKSGTVETSELTKDEGFVFEAELDEEEEEEEGESSSNSAAATKAPPAKRGASGREKANIAESRLVHVSKDLDIDRI